jgi:hypothetical protein
MKFTKRFCYKRSNDLNTSSIEESVKSMVSCLVKITRKMSQQNLINYVNGKDDGNKITLQRMLTTLILSLHRNQS